MESLNRLGSTVGHCPKIANSPILQRLIGKIRELEVIGDDPISEIKEEKEVFYEFRSDPECAKAKGIAKVHPAEARGPTLSLSFSLPKHEIEKFSHPLSTRRQESTSDTTY